MIVIGGMTGIRDAHCQMANGNFLFRDDYSHTAVHDINRVRLFYICDLRGASRLNHSTGVNPTKSQHLSPALTRILSLTLTRAQTAQPQVKHVTALH